MAKRPPPPPRGPDGRFIKEHSGNPKGRPKRGARRPSDQADKIAIRQPGGGVRMEETKRVIMKRLAAAAISDKDVTAAEIYLREDRLRQKLAARPANDPRQPRPKSPVESLYYEEVLRAFGIIKKNRRGQWVIPDDVFADLERQCSRGEFSSWLWEMAELAVETPSVLRIRYPNRKLKHRTEGEASRARADALEKVYADYEAMMADVEGYQRFKAWEAKNR